MSILFSVCRLLSPLSRSTPEVPYASVSIHMHDVMSKAFPDRPKPILIGGYPGYPRFFRQQ